MKKLLVTLLVTSGLLVACSYKDNSYVCELMDKSLYQTSLRIEGKKLTLGTRELKYCTNIGNEEIYHSNCIKNEYGNYESAVWFDPITMRLTIIGSGGIAPIELLKCSKSK